MSAEDYGNININLIQFESIIIKYSNKPLEFNPSPLRLELLCLSKLADWKYVFFALSYFQKSEKILKCGKAKIYVLRYLRVGEINLIK